MRIFDNRVVPVIILFTRIHVLYFVEARAGAYGGSSTNSSLTLDFGDYIPDRHPVNSPNQNRSPYKTPTPAPRIGRLSTVRMAHDRTRTPSPLLISKDTSEGQPEEQSYSKLCAFPAMTFRAKKTL